MKKANQLALIWELSAAEPPDAAEGAADVGAVELAMPLALLLAPLLALPLAEGLEPDEPPLLPQAATVIASTATAAGAAMENTLTGRIRI